ncbi:uncharacterized protein EV420DRAFT_922138 [Desarmillaria tabescens]|uniref:Transmembrane protein n=1 Tax=Armillaria tabescens TaxID=1929756 RepID=A0AA39JMT2_ARMTA|nr:uncharacterized protein EV420DRAFT_922138 [Desarmillaria tabescens]KAK0445642.1 hypothetical protein EV420DRAFT_922138 [Desarmillaria tabescens]
MSWVYVLFVAFVAVQAKLVNVTVDDQNLSLTYTPSDAWVDGTDCEACTAKLDTDRLVRGTWHDSTFQPGDKEPHRVSVSFNGTAIYVDCILVKSTSNPPLNGHSDMRFFIDGALVGRFARDIANDSTSTYEYGSTVYANTCIPAGLHTFRLQNGHTNSTQQSLVLLDAITYSYDDGEPDGSVTVYSTATESLGITETGTPDPEDAVSSESSNVASVVAPAVVIPLVLVASIFALALYLRRRRRRRHPVIGVYGPSTWGQPTYAATTSYPPTRLVSSTTEFDPSRGPAPPAYEASVRGTGVLEEDGKIRLPP